MISLSAKTINIRYNLYMPFPFFISLVRIKQKFNSSLKSIVVTTDFAIFSTKLLSNIYLSSQL